MYLARFSYDVAPANRQRALDSIHQELESARKSGLEARILIPLTRAHGGAALQFEVALESLDQLETFRHRGALDARLQRDSSCPSGGRDSADRRAPPCLATQRRIAPAADPHVLVTSQSRFEFATIEGRAALVRDKATAQGI